MEINTWGYLAAVLLTVIGIVFFVRGMSAPSYDTAWDLLKKYGLAFASWGLAVAVAALVHKGIWAQFLG